MIVSQILVMWLAASAVGLFVALMINALDLEYYAPFNCDLWLGELSAKNLILSASAVILWAFVCGIFDIPFWLPS
jgi:hypothetical protein